MIETLSEITAENLNINYKANRTGYNFIQLALYGYDELDFGFGVARSYSTDFIVELIRIAKKYNLDVNTTDIDGDTIIHTALASEIYEGNVMPLLKELGMDFDITKKDNNGNNIYEALLFYKKEAEACGNISWLNRLSNEESEIKMIIEQGKPIFEEKNKELVKIKVEPEKLVDYMDTDSMDTDSLDSKAIDTNLFGNYAAEQIYNKLEEKIKNSVLIVINEYLKKLTSKPTTKELKELKLLLQTNSLKKELEILDSKKNQYQKFIQQLKVEINNSSSSLADLIQCETNLANFNDDIVKEELLNLIRQREKNFNSIIENIQNVMLKVEMIESWSITTGIISFEQMDEEKPDFTIMDEKTLLEYYQTKLEVIKKYKENILRKFGELMVKVNSFDDLTYDNILTHDELEEVKLKSIQKVKSPKKRN